MDDGQWVVARGEERYQAPDLGTIRGWAAGGSLRPDDRIWNPATGQWMIAKNHAEIAAAFPAVAAAPRVMTATAAVAPTGVRIAAYLIDVIPAFLIALIGLIPIVGQIVAGLLLSCYWLFRDVNGASIGKLLLGLRVVAVNGGEASIGARVGRNAILIIGPLLIAIPIIGYFLGGPVAFVIGIVEILMVLTQGYRLGDKLAGTKVVKLA